MRHLAWLHAPPDPDGKGNIKDRRTRAERFAAEEEGGAYRPELIPPEIDPELSYLVEHLMAVGPASAGEVLTFLEINAWAAATGLVLDAWEAATLRALSRTYLTEYQAARDPNRAGPGGQAIKQAKPTRSEISQRISDLFARLEARDAKGLAPK